LPNQWKDASLNLALTQLQAKTANASYIIKPAELRFINDELALRVLPQKYNSHLHRDVELTKQVWERSQKTSHFKTASNSF